MAATRRTFLSAAPLLVLTATLAGGCASQPPPDTETRIHSGRFAATIRRGGKPEAVSGRFTLATSPRRTMLDLASPLGNTLARVEAGADGATLTAPQNDGTMATWQGDNADALLESVLGVALPVAGLPDWIDGRPTPRRPARLSPADGPAQRIEQDGWTIVIDERFEHSGMPRRLTLERGSAQADSPALVLRLVLDAPGDPDPDRSHR